MTIRASVRNSVNTVIGSRKVCFLYGWKRFDACRSEVTTFTRNKHTMKSTDTRYNSGWSDQNSVWSDHTLTTEPREREKHVPKGVTIHTIGNASRGGMNLYPGAKALSRKLVDLFKGSRSDRPPEKLKVHTTYLEPVETVRLRDGTTISYLPYSVPYSPWPTWNQPIYYGGMSGSSFGNEIRNWSRWLSSSPLSYRGGYWNGPQMPWLGGWQPAWQPAWQPVWQQTWQPAHEPAWQSEQRPRSQPARQREEQRANMPQQLYRQNKNRKTI